MRKKFLIVPQPVSGFTLIELLVGMTIIGFLFAGGFNSYRNFSRKQQLAEAANQIKSDLLLAQQRALSGEKPATCTGILNGYLVIFASRTSFLPNNTSTFIKPVWAEASLSVAPATVAAGGAVSVSWSDITNPRNASLWLQDGTFIGEIPGWQAGSQSFIIPGSVAGGVYYMRLREALCDDTGNCTYEGRFVAVSNYFQVTAPTSSPTITPTQSPTAAPNPTPTPPPSAFDIYADCGPVGHDQTDLLIKSVGLPAGVVKTGGPDTIFFKVLGQGTAFSDDQLITLMQTATNETTTITISKAGSIN